jgi:hypothetical protein
MKVLSIVVSVVGMAVVLASPAEAAKKKSKHTRSAATTQTMQHRQSVGALSQAGVGYQGGVLKGPLYNGPDYIGDDPDPNIRARLMKDMTRYQGSY